MKKDIIHHGRNIARFRKMKHLSQEEFANELKAPRTTVAYWEQSERVSDDAIKQVSEYFKIDPWFIEFATDEDVFAKFSYNNIGVVAEHGAVSKVGVSVVEEGTTVEYNENNPLEAVLAIRKEERDRFISEIERLQKELDQARASILEYERKQNKQLMEENQRLKDNQK